MTREGETHKTKQWSAYTDGSSDIHNYPQAVAYGYVLVDNEQEVVDQSYGYSEDKDWVKMANVAGELLGAVQAIEAAQQQGVTHLSIYHDYEGVGKWANREWKTGKPQTRAYVQYIDRMRERITITFQWVKGHNGNTFNELADDLAKKGFNKYKETLERR